MPQDPSFVLWTIAGTLVVKIVFDWLSNRGNYSQNKTLDKIVNCLSGSTSTLEKMSDRLDRVEEKINWLKDVHNSKVDGEFTWHTAAHLKRLQETLNKLVDTQSKSNELLSKIILKLDLTIRSSHE